jgi:hypothetical protein
MKVIVGKYEDFVEFLKSNFEEGEEKETWKLLTFYFKYSSKCMHLSSKLQVTNYISLVIYARIWILENVTCYFVTSHFLFYLR